MNVSHLHIKFAAIVKRPFRPHLRLAQSKTGSPKPSVGSPEVTPESGAFKHVGIRQRPSLQPSRRAAGPSYLHARRFRWRSQALHGRSRLCGLGFHVTAEAPSAGYDLYTSPV